MKTVIDYYNIAFKVWFSEMLLYAKEDYTAADMAILSITMILEGRF